MDSDSEPEEVGLPSAAQQAKALQRAQQSARLAASAQQKQLRREQAAKREQQQLSSKKAKKKKEQEEQQEDEDAAEPSAEAHDGDGYALDGADLLPADVIAALESHHRQPSVAAAAPAHAEQGPDSQQHQQQLQQARALRKQKLAQGLKKGPVVVKVIGASDKSLTGARSTFLKDQLYGERHKRSVEMLRPRRQHAAAASSQPAAKFV